MKFSLSICFLCLCAIAAQAQQIATTSDGKKVVLNTDGTWKYAEASPTVTLKVEAGLIYKDGPQPVARTPFVLLDTNPTPELMKLPRDGSLGGLTQLSVSCRHNDYPEAPAIVRKYVRYTFTTGFDGKGELGEIKPGKYWLAGVAPTRSAGCVLWLMEIDLTKNQNLTLDQNNAVPLGRL